MSAQVLRQAASLMRERALAADALGQIADTITTSTCQEFADHIAGWHPAVALAIAEWLDGCAARRLVTSDARMEHDREEQEWYLPALHVARAYLGDSA